jgi:hypothetical protein
VVRGALCIQARAIRHGPGKEIGPEKSKPPEQLPVPAHADLLCRPAPSLTVLHSFPDHDTRARSVRASQSPSPGCCREGGGERVTMVSPASAKTEGSCAVLPLKEPKLRFSMVFCSVMTFLPFYCWFLCHRCSFVGYRNSTGIA